MPLTSVQSVIQLRRGPSGSIVTQMLPLQKKVTAQYHHGQIKSLEHQTVFQPYSQWNPVSRKLALLTMLVTEGVDRLAGQSGMLPLSYSMQVPVQLLTGLQDLFCTNRCHKCGATNTPEWRKGLNVKGTLCNACDS